ncbi:UDP-glycosyltransferase 73C4-like [Lotus japonicus]|uniref:UDP-glycosyltransferase 73C4-like n=1 Tax=Lotus japonicus TaxID=34305 RepID=UPI002588DA5F|nr:UDP-glycosyltransferase 73C4-like [Lotus japonicus]
MATTPLNAARIRPMLHLSTTAPEPHNIQLVELHVPLLESGLPKGCESMELVPSRNLIRNFLEAFSKLQKQVEQLIEEMKPAPTCLLVDKHLHWTQDVSRKFQIPRLLFDGTCCFYLLSIHNLLKSKSYNESVPDSQPIMVPSLPHKIELTISQLPLDLNPESQDFSDIHQKIRASEEGAYGMVVNSFQDLELDYVKEYKKVKDGKVWCIGPVSLSYRGEQDLAKRGNKATVDENFCMKWLDSWPPRSVVYVCLGTLNRLALVQFKELALSLEACNKPFIWVMREDYSGEGEKWLLEDGYEERTKGRGFIIRGWAPQVSILSHPAIGVFLTHCGWNSTLEAICAGVPMVTWPMFGDQFLNQKLIVQILGVGEELGNEVFVPIGKQDKFGAMIKGEKILEAIDKVMGEGTQKGEKRERARKLAKLAKQSMEAGRSSYENLKMLVEDIAKLAFGNPPQ